MKRIIFLSFIILLTSEFSFGSTYYSLADGDWQDAIWSTNINESLSNGQHLPNSIEGGHIGNKDEIVIRHGVTNNSGIKITNGGTITVENGGYFDVSDVDMNNGSTLLVENGGTLAAGAINNNKGAITNNGTILSPDCSQITGGNGDCSNAILPVELTAFEAQVDGRSTKLTWSTASELNNDFFTLERSKNGKDFKVITKIEGNGTINTVSNYTYYDEDPYLGLSYYRLSQTDFDGTTEVFQIVSVVSTSGKNSFTVGFSPMDNQLSTLKVEGRAKNELVELNVINLQGELVDKRHFTTDNYGNVETEFHINRQLQKGAYIFVLISGSQKESLKVLHN